jgi:hypothetical protein
MLQTSNTRSYTLSRSSKTRSYIILGASNTQSYITLRASNTQGYIILRQVIHEITPVTDELHTKLPTFTHELPTITHPPSPLLVPHLLGLAL